MKYELKAGYSLPFFADGTMILTILQDNKPWLQIRCVGQKEEETRSKVEFICDLLNEYPH
jgi:hypothetical protein